jgi:Resolvase, N terminal domain
MYTRSASVSYCVEKPLENRCCAVEGFPMKRAVLYLRVSTLDQTTANQELELRQVAESAGWQIVHVYRDHDISGTKSKDKRPAFNALHKAAARREFARTCRLHRYIRTLT